MTDQEVFDLVAHALLKQGRPSTNPDVSWACLYRGPKGLKCAAGHLIPDARYSPDMEGSSIGALVHAGMLADVPAIRDHLDLVVALQEAHDRATCRDWPDAWKKRMRHVAASFGLSAAALQVEP